MTRTGFAETDYELELIDERTDHYFAATKLIVETFGDVWVTYAVFLRRPVISAPRLVLEWLDQLTNYGRAQSRTPRVVCGVEQPSKNYFEIEVLKPEGTLVGAGEPILYVSGMFSDLVQLETIILQKLGSACVAAYNAYQMCLSLPKVKFIDMAARHCSGREMQHAMAYGAAVGSRRAQDKGAVGFIGGSVDETAFEFGQGGGLGTMPHALIGYAGSTLAAVGMYIKTFPTNPITVLPDYFGREVTDMLEVCRTYHLLAEAGSLSVRLDTHGGRYMEGLDTASSYAVLERHVPNAIRQYRSQEELQILIGTGVSAAAIWFMREKLDDEGFVNVQIVGSSGFDVTKCRVMAEASAPIDVIGTGSFIPDSWKETYATADIIEYEGRPSVKVGREFLLRKSE